MSHLTEAIALSRKTVKLGSIGFDRWKKKKKKKEKKRKDMIEIKNKNKNQTKQKRLVILCQTFRNDSEATVFLLFFFSHKRFK